MVRIACKDGGEVSCLLANLLAELEQPCEHCWTGEAMVLTGTSPAGEKVAVRLLPGLTLEVEGVPEDAIAAIRERRCLHG